MTPADWARLLHVLAAHDLVGRALSSSRLPVALPRFDEPGGGGGRGRGEYVTNADQAIRVEYDEGRVICRGCLLVMETDESDGWWEARPLCFSCWREAVNDKAEQGGEG